MAAKSKKNNRIFVFGDEVEIDGEKHIIEECQGSEDIEDFEYSTNKGAWFTADEIKFLKPSSLKSRRKLIKDNDDEMGEEIV